MGVATVSVEEAALAAGALAELRASVAVVAGRLDVVERQVTGDAQSREDLAHALAQQRCKRAETSNHISAVNDICEQLSAKLEHATSDWHARHSQLESHLVSLQRSCKDVNATCAGNATDIQRLDDCCISTSSQLKNFLAEWHSKHCQVDSRLLCLEQSCRDLQSRAIDMAECNKEAAQVDSRLLCLEQSCRDFQLRIIDMAKQLKEASHGGFAQAEFDMQLRDIHLRLDDHDRSVRACKEETENQCVPSEFERQLAELRSRLEEQELARRDDFDRQASPNEPLDHTLDAAVAKLDDHCGELRERIGVLAEGSKRLAAEAEARLSALESFRLNLTRDPPWQCAAATSVATPKKESAICLSWEVEARLRDIAEEVYSVSEHAMTTYVDAVRAELSERVEQCLEQACLPPLDQSLSCSDAFLEEGLVSADAPCGIDDATEPRKAKVCCNSHTPSLSPSAVKDVSSDDWPHRPAIPSVSSDGGTGGFQQDAAAGARRQAQLHADSQLDLSATATAAVSASAGTSSAPTGRPAGLARRLRSPSPVESFPECGTAPLPPPRVPCTSPCSALT